MFRAATVKDLQKFDKIRYQDKIYNVAELTEEGATLKVMLLDKTSIFVSSDSKVDVWLSDRGDRRLHREKLDLDD